MNFIKLSFVQPPSPPSPYHPRWSSIWEKKKKKRHILYRIYVNTYQFINWRYIWLINITTALNPKDICGLRRVISTTVVSSLWNMRSYTILQFCQWRIWKSLKKKKKKLNKTHLQLSYKHGNLHIIKWTCIRESFRSSFITFYTSNEIRQWYKYIRMTHLYTSTRRSRETI